MLSDKIIQELIDKFFKDNTLTSHQIDSYNDYIDNIFPMIISQFFPIELEYPESDKIKKIIINIKDINIEPPYYTENNGCTKIMKPNIARLRNFTYSLIISSNISVNLIIKQDEEIINLPEKIINNVIISKIPIIQIKILYIIN